MCNLIVGNGLPLLLWTIDPPLTFDWKDEEAVEELEWWAAAVVAADGRLVMDECCRSRMEIKFSLSSSSFWRINFLLLLLMLPLLLLDVVLLLSEKETLLSLEPDVNPLLDWRTCCGWWLGPDWAPGLQEGCNRNGPWQSVLGESLIIKISRNKRNLRTRRLHTRNQPRKEIDWLLLCELKTNVCDCECTNRWQWSRRRQAT